MQYTPFGAAGEVTGSRHMLTLGDDERILLDCGLFQGSGSSRRAENHTLPFNPATLSAVVLSHAHIDHSGCLPLLYRQGYKGPIYATAATRDVLELMLMDTAHVQRQEYEYSLRHPSGGAGPLPPLYDEQDVQKTLGHVETLEYGACTKVSENAALCFSNSGHILGSSITHLNIATPDGPLRLAYTGDLGKQHIPIIDRPAPLPETDVLLTESTYGDRQHEDLQDTEATLARVVAETMARGGKVYIPAFALGRMQSIIYLLHRMMDDGRISRVPVYVDSPLGVDITKVFSNHPECFDSETRQHFLDRKDPPFQFSQLTYVASVEESKRLNHKPGPFIIVASSGMLEGGRMLFHLMNGIDDERNTILIVGYMAEGTLGRQILDGSPRVTIFHRELPVRAKIVKLNALSAHADRDELVTFIKTASGLRKVFLVHGEEGVRQDFAERLKKELPDLSVVLPTIGQSYDLP